MRRMALLGRRNKINPESSEAESGYVFPKNVLHSIRFGAHWIEWKPTIQIVPVCEKSLNFSQSKHKSERLKKTPSARFALAPAECRRNFSSWFIN